MSPVRHRLLAVALGVLGAAQVGALAFHTSPLALAAKVVGVATSSPDARFSAAADDVQPASSTSSTSTGDSPPTVTPVITGTLGNAGWYTSDVQLSWTLADDETPVSSSTGCDPQSVTADTDGVTFTCTANSDGGSTTATATIARDATAPEGVSVSADRAPDAGGFYNHAFTATWSGTDATSGVASCTSTPYSGPDVSSGSLDGSCADVAGNQSASVPFAFAYDGTAPGVTGTPDRVADHDGWYTGPVTVTWSSDDAGATCDGPSTYSGPDSATASVTGACTDSAGNAGTGTFDFKFDTTAPVITITTPADEGIYILRQPIAADYSCADAVGATTCAGPVADGAAPDTASVGSKTFEVVATDAAGHETRATSSYAVQYQPAGVKCGGVAGHSILSPIDAGGGSVFQRNSTVPAKFRVCDWFGKSVTADGVVQSFRIVSAAGAETDQPVASTSKPHDSFRAGASQWIFNIATKSLSESAYGFRIALDDGTDIGFGFGLR